MMLPWYQNIPFASIFLLMIAGVLMLLMKRGKSAFILAFTVSLTVAALSAVLTVALYTGNERFVYTMGEFPAPWGNELAAGPLEALLAFMFSMGVALSLLGGRSDAANDILAPKQSIFYLMMCELTAAMLALTYTNDIFTGYVFIEISTLSACSIVMARDTAKTIVATIRYLVISLLGSGLFLIGVVMLYCITGHLLIPQLGEKIAELVATGTYTEPLTIVAGLLFIGVAIKSALFPFYAWLPFAHGGATTSSSAVLSGLVLKSYIILLVKLFYEVFTIEVIRSLKVTNIMFAFGVIGMLVGSWRAIKEEHIKRMLAYSSVSQVGYIFMGLGLGTNLGVAAAFYQILVHAATKPMLFISAGRLIDVQGHEKSLYRLRGAARSDPLAGVLFTLGALSMIGLPLLAGFIVKFGLASASLINPHRMWIALGALVVSTVLNALYYLPAVIALWTPSGFMVRVKQPRDWRFAVSASAFGAFVVLLGVSCLPVIDLIENGLALWT
ncbi:MAG TPA: proton-conducting transporter membrane subunit [Eubacteriales bacterium]|nr:proton-conducting transporter membrane subunit [Eubacteriales bacterium]